MLTFLVWSVILLIAFITVPMLLGFFLLIMSILSVMLFAAVITVVSHVVQFLEWSARKLT
jgi:hypothetical protein